MALNKYAKRLLQDVIKEIEANPDAFDAYSVRLVKKSKKVPYGVIGNIPCKIAEVAGIDVHGLLSAMPEEYRYAAVYRLAEDLLDMVGVYSSGWLFKPAYWPESVANDPIKRIKLYLKTHGEE